MTSISIPRRAFAAAALAALLTRAPAKAAAPPQDRWPELADGGCVVFRHANAPGVGDPPGMRLSDCATQRNLDELGRAQARAIGSAFRARGLRIDRVATSRWCRARDTAELAFPGMATVDPAFDSFFDAPHLREATTAEARRAILGWRGPGLLVAVTHAVNIAALTGISPRPAEGIVLSVRTADAFVRGRITPSGPGMDGVAFVRG